MTMFGISMAICTALSVSLPSSGWGVFAFQNETTPIVAKADETQKPSVSAPTTSVQLVSPSSYEQYLPLLSPTDVSVHANYTAIADGNVIYLYNRFNEQYSEYKHTSKITKLQFTANGQLYFLDADLSLQILSPDDRSVEKTDLHCSTFLLQEDDIYFTKVSTSTQILQASLDDLQNDYALCEIPSPPLLAFYQDALYYTDSGKHLYKLPLDKKTLEPEFIAVFHDNLTSMTIAENSLFYTDTKGNFTAFDLSILAEKGNADNTPTLSQFTGGYKSVSLHNQKIYVLQNQMVRQYVMKTRAFTDYEIGTTSFAENRILNGVEMHLSDETLFIADNGNQRISVYDTQTDTFGKPIATNLQPQYLTANEKTVLLASKTKAILLSLSKENYGQVLTEKDSFHGEIVGIASVYDKYYLLTNKNQFLCLSSLGEGWAWSVSQKTSTKYPSFLTADAYGELYVLYGNDLYAYTEKEFLSATPSERVVCENLADDVKKIAVDYRKNLYALDGNRLQKYSLQNGNYAKDAVFTLDADCVYGITPSVQSFAVSIKENETYVLYQNNYLVKTEDCNLPTVKNILVNGADKDLLDSNNTDFSVVNVAQGGLLIEFDLSALKSATYFPFLSYERLQSARSALKIGETDIYYIVAMYNQTTRAYSTYLVERTACEELPLSDYQTLYSAEAQTTGYLTNRIALYRLPYIHSLLTVSTMERNAPLTLLGEIRHLDREYYLVSYTNAQGTHTGYVPKSYVTNLSPTPNTQTPTYGEEESDVDSVWRMAYLLLSFGGICVLGNFLLLRKPKQETVEETEDTSQNL